MKDRTVSIFNHFLARYPNLKEIGSDVLNSVASIVCCYYEGGKVLVCGNGGSASDSEHIVGELMKGFRLKRPIDLKNRELLEKKFPRIGVFIADHIQTPIPAISLVSQTALMTAYCNDIEPEMVFAQQAYGYCKEKDILIAMSTSGNSKNIIYAAMVAKTIGTKVIGFTGKDGGELAEIGDITISVPENETFAVQELHLPVYHVICSMVESEIFDT